MGGDSSCIMGYDSSSIMGGDTSCVMEIYPVSWKETHFLSWEKSIPVPWEEIHPQWWEETLHVWLEEIHSLSLEETHSVLWKGNETHCVSWEETLGLLEENLPISWEEILSALWKGRLILYSYVKKTSFSALYNASFMYAKDCSLYAYWPKFSHRATYLGLVCTCTSINYQTIIKTTQYTHLIMSPLNWLTLFHFIFPTILVNHHHKMKT